MPTIRIGDHAPDFWASTSVGAIKLHEWMGSSWAMFFSHPKDFTPICTTELGLMAQIEADFAKRDCKIIGHSIDSVDEHMRWLDDIEKIHGVRPSFPIIGDPDLKIAKLYDMLPESAVPGIRSAADNATVRAVFVISPDKKIKLTSSYPMTVGRNFREILRTLDSLQITSKFKLATPVNWEEGQDFIIPPSVSDEEAKKLFPGGWTAVRPYLRTVKPSTIGL